MKPSQRAAINAFVTSGIVVAFIVVGIAWFFHPTWDTWSSPWMWGSLVFIWFMGAGKGLNTCLQEETLNSLNRIERHK